MSLKKLRYNDYERKLHQSKIFTILSQLPNFQLFDVVLNFFISSFPKIDVRFKQSYDIGFLLEMPKLRLSSLN